MRLYFTTSITSSNSHPLLIDFTTTSVELLDDAYEKFPVLVGIETPKPVGEKIIFAQPPKPHTTS